MLSLIDSKSKDYLITNEELALLQDNYQDNNGNNSDISNDYRTQQRDSLLSFLKTRRSFYRRFLFKREIENDSSLFAFYGGTELTYLLSNRSGSLSEKPASYLRLEIAPSVKIYGVPFDFDFILSTEENSSNVNIIRGTLGYQMKGNGLNFTIKQKIDGEIEKLKQNYYDNIADSLKLFGSLDSTEFMRQIESLYHLKNSDVTNKIDSLEQLGLISKEQAFIYQFPSLAAGKVTPLYPELFMNGVAISGATAEFNPGNFYSAISIGKLEKNVETSYLSTLNSELENDFSTPVLYKNLYAGRLGYGRFNGNNVILSILYAKDDEQSSIIQKLVDTTASILSTEENLVLGTSFHLYMDSTDFMIDGSINTSLFTKDINSVGVNNQPLPNIYKSIYGNLINSSSKADFALDIKSAYKIFNKSGRLYWGFRYIGPGYQSVGSPFLRSDLISSNLLYDQTLLDRQIRFSTGIFIESNGYILGELNKSFLTRINGNVELRFPSFPVFNVNIYNNNQNFYSIYDSTDHINNNTNVMVNCNYAYQIDIFRSQTNLSYNLQNSISDDTHTKFNSENLTLNHNMAYSFVTSSLTGSYINTKTNYDTTSHPVFFWDLLFIFNPYSWINGAIGTSHYYTEEGKIEGFNINILVFPWDTFNFELEFEIRSYTNKYDSSFDFIDKIGKAVLRYYW